MSKYKVNIDPEIPSDEQIAKSQDFEKLLKKKDQQYNPVEFRKGMHKKRNLIMIVVTVVAVALALFFT